ncbi:ChaN family lipoprotein [Neptunomonas antarctica]|uniref:Uncharacterized iron-regulated protein n=1 Tax=Neptunomonas antarctica TaxID=619304 RepID=A0A1N7KY00_9GAMM|nr:ChaN family lipoprotein [Neptunomonas antarctica]SIS66458.1 Uncharacterized iron-regulated protein [Neptunomonas antarctica]
MFLSTLGIKRVSELFVKIASYSLILFPVYGHTSNLWLAPLLQDHTLVGKIYNIEQQQFISEAALFSALQQTPYILVGEKHDNNDHHRLEQRILEQLLNDSSTQVVFEMLTLEQQSKINTLNTDDTLEKMNQKLEWNDKGWPWNDYGPLIETAVRRHASIKAGNINTSTIKEIYRLASSQQTSSAAGFKTVEKISDKVKETILNQVYESHCQMMPRDQLVPMLAIQLERDASMANAMVTTGRGPSVLIAGSFHTLKDVGVPLHLQQLTHSTLKTLLLSEVAEGKNNPEDYASSSEADYIWFTPMQSNEDHCDDLRLRHKSSADQ